MVQLFNLNYLLNGGAGGERRTDNLDLVFMKFSFLECTEKGLNADFILGSLCRIIY